MISISFSYINFISLGKPIVFTMVDLVEFAKYINSQ